jgi:hypothetical protein
MFFLNLLECILYMWLINIIVIKLKIILMLIIKLKNIYIFNTLKLVYGYLFIFMTRIKNNFLFHVFTLWHVDFLLRLGDVQVTFGILLIVIHNNHCIYYVAHLPFPLSQIPLILLTSPSNVWMPHGSKVFW